MYKTTVIKDLKKSLQRAVSNTGSGPTSELEHRFIALLLENLEDTYLREYRYEIMYILLCYSTLSAKKQDNIEKAVQIETEDNDLGGLAW